MVAAAVVLLVMMVIAAAAAAVAAEVVGCEGDRTISADVAQKALLIDRLVRLCCSGFTVESFGQLHQWRIDF